MRHPERHLLQRLHLDRLSLAVGHLQIAVGHLQQSLNELEAATRD